MKDQSTVSINMNSKLPTTIEDVVGWLREQDLRTLALIADAAQGLADAKRAVEKLLDTEDEPF